jgi:signal transduction histidine kinase
LASDEESEHENEAEDPALEGSPFDLDSFDADLAPLFVVSSASQALRPVAVNRNLPLTAPYAPAAEAAMLAGSDLRTTHLEDGTALRLLTVRLPSSGPPQVIQVGRTLDDQQRVLDGLLRMLAMLGALGALALASGSWWLAGKSLVPAQHAWEKQQAFVANASHELRAPLTLMRASAEVAQRGMPEGDSRRALLGDVLSEVDHMAALVDDLLLLSRLDAGRLQLESQSIPLSTLVAEIERTFGRVAENSGVTLTHQVDEGLAVRGDPTRFRQVLLILLDNALRHTPSGGEVTIRARGSTSRVQIEVQDSGPGIAPEDLPHVFERFYRSNHRGVDAGSGLGLAIARGLIGAQGGSISLENALPTGTLARVILPRG